MSRRVALALAVALLAISVPVRAEKPSEVKDQCRAVGLLMFEVSTLKITVVPQRIEVSYPQPGEFAREVCFVWKIMGSNDKFEKLELKDFEKTKGATNKDLFKRKKLYTNTTEFISLEFDDVPIWDPDNDGQKTDVVVAYRLEAQFKVGGVVKDVSFDPEIIIKKPGG